ncbi:50S ribosomal protein L23 [Methermicoccus shengliensis]|uniref:Large ribosomal subunit protein uL23 n=1 Tax=Methermicoccus shengliensis TaxID=660064 RepID=A0A832RX95_9EURY|nr:50S ribosomal protein L23 [Methermicoccus shengliensis]KUK05116.1 MAG: 50S ribosomal protein L23P [Euryarchaeota archaeon 55_53]KUK30682.1 MAG: 50S ribosomal protein L23P [Methanosarcinales archeaon 56_1174]MDI3488432.1 large subunit ribosomal protein [Methanosarcinales archaeon]MDN5294649.1 large subunit ribosomal protein [Methanosarcinales archaeon]HIH69359.1 50S ribosomal protein L23 [Methermicoccus shengliensis]
MVIGYPFVSEKATILLEEQGKLQMIVDVRATKQDIKRAIESMYEFKVKAVNTMVTPDGKKKAIITFEQSDAAHEIASRIGVF